MSTMPKDRLLTILLVGILLIGGGYILVRIFGEPAYEIKQPLSTTPGQPSPDVTPAPTPDIFANTDETTPSSPAASVDSGYAQLGDINLFAPIFTPTPTPTPAPPRATPGPNLQQALKNWKLEYPLQQGAKWVFSEQGRPNEVITLEVGKTATISDGRQTFDVTVERDGRWAVIIKYQEQQVRFSMIE